MMNELYCANEIMKELGAIHNCLRYIDEDFLIPVWIIAISLAILALMTVGISLYSGIYMVILTKRQMSVFDNKSDKQDIKKIIRKAQRRAKHRKEEMEYETEEEI